MARTVKVEENDLEIIGSSVTHPPADIGDSSDDAEGDPLALLLGQLGGGGEQVKLNISRLPGERNKNRVFCFSCNADDYDLGELSTKAQQHGGGDYEILASNARGRIIARRRFCVDDPVKQREIAMTAPAPDNSHQLVDFMAQQTSIMKEMFGQLAAKLDRPTVDPMEVQRQTLETLSTMRDIFTPPAQLVANASGSTPGSMMGQLKELMELRDFLRSDKEPGESNNLMDMAREFLPPLVEMARQRAPAAPTSAPTLPTPAATHQPTPRPVPAVQPKQENPAMFELIKGLNMLMDAAKRGADPALYAELVLDQFDDAMLDQYLAPQNYLDIFAKFAPTIRQYAPWFDQLRAIVLEIMHADDAQDSPIDTCNADDLPVDGHTAGLVGYSVDVAGDGENGAGRAGENTHSRPGPEPD